MTSPDIPLNRRALLALGAAAAAASSVAHAKETAMSTTENTVSKGDQFWPDDAWLAVSFSLMFEAGGQPISGAPGSFGPMEKGAPDLATSGLFQYGVYEGIPRILPHLR